MIILAIDPGLDGAVSCTDEDGKVCAVLDLPTELRGTGTKRQIDTRAFSRLLRETHLQYQQRMYAWVELVGAMPIRRNDGAKPQGAASAFNFGDTAGAIRGVLGALEIPYEYVRPQAWKKGLGLVKTSKEEDRLEAIKRHPEAEQYLTRKKDHNRAEAILIGDYAMTQPSLVLKKAG